MHAVILAGGDGVRLRSLTRSLSGDDRPKQFVPLAGAKTLLEQTLDRVALLVPPQQTQIVLTRAHEPYFENLRRVAPRSSFAVQPSNRGTAVAVLYALLRIAQRTPRTPVAILPSDHWVSDDLHFMMHVATALRVAQEYPGTIVLLGIAPTRPETQYGWIEPWEPLPGPWPGVRRVRSFIEKPTQDLATVFHAKGFLWNSFVVVGHMGGLLPLIAEAQPAILDAFLSVRTSLGKPEEEFALEKLYQRLPSVDFSKHVLSAKPQALAVLPVEGVAWDDLGDPVRAVATRNRALDLETRVSSPPRSERAAGADS